ncbi:GFA family protein [Rhizobium halophytocola]|uniref:CENP-V/GFA domain-containing protein n=1 Tax=Rhizobium halophytocola TaxID=735519 RepID=A0ABS4DYL1_9HYPH|nr:GFA family protein [Rhizobium halophytocola]MBP1850729.1 hypothetical protein [Rhizobium halophytocola]
MNFRLGGCLCGDVRYTVEGEPLRVGLCHCSACRKESGSMVTCFVVYPRSALKTTGHTASYAGRHFCPRCGGRLFIVNDEEAEIRLGSLDRAPSDFRPAYEIWVKRREAWLSAIEGIGQWPADRVG